LNVVEELALFQLTDRLLPIVPLPLQARDVVVQAVMNVLDVLRELTAVTPIYINMSATMQHSGGG